MAARMKAAVFWKIAPCSFVEVYQRFRDAYCLHHQGDCWEFRYFPPSLIALTTSCLQGDKYETLSVSKEVNILNSVAFITGLP